MKLYTEEQVNKAMLDYAQGILPIDILNSLTPIELPSDEEIYINSNVNSENVDYNLGVIKGIQIMKELIQGGNK